MLINADFTRRATVAAHQYQWVASPQTGVERVMLDRVGAEKARATSIVRYAPQSRFARHQHPGGEEILVLSGTFSDEGGDYPTAWYLRNPPGSSHMPFSDEGATIFVKLWQMPPHEKAHVRIHTGDPAAWHPHGGGDICPLFAGDAEQVCLLRLAPHQRLLTEPVNGAELLVLAGALALDGQAYETGSWMRFPVGALPDIAAGAGGATVYRKTGHLAGVAVGS
jgi:anti-sigma factor ChrR (cupin superfamily)